MEHMTSLYSLTPSLLPSLPHTSPLLSLFLSLRVKVHFLDHGNTEDVSTSSVGPLLEKYQVFPFQMLQCCFSTDPKFSYGKREVHVHTYIHTCIHTYIDAYYQEFIMWEGRRVSNALYTLYNMSSESNMTSRLAHVTKPRSSTIDFSPDCGE